MHNSDEITASFDSLMDDAQSTATTFLGTAKRRIDEIFGSGYAAANPQLVAAFIQCAASDLSSSTNAKVIGAALRKIATSLDSISNAMENK